MRYVRRMEMMAHIRVKLLTIPTSAGGRRSAFYSGYRPHFRYRGEENGITITTYDDHGVEPGDSCDAMITFLRPDLQTSRLQTGSSFMIAEGWNNTAHGTITEILDETMIDPTPRKESVIFVDVDDTLIRSFGSKQIPIPNAVEYVRSMFNAGHVLYCWSRGGAQYSREIATKLGIADCFVCFLPKPDVVLDDRLEDLLEHCEFIHPMNAVPPQKSTNNPMPPSGGSGDS